MDFFPWEYASDPYEALGGRWVRYRRIGKKSKKKGSATRLSEPTHLWSLKAMPWGPMRFGWTHYVKWLSLIGHAKDAKTDERSPVLESSLKREDRRDPSKPQKARRVSPASWVNQSISRPLSLTQSQRESQPTDRSTRPLGPICCSHFPCRTVLLCTCAVNKQIREVKSLG